ncbi:hypothetical protein PPACK8108_LOCUS3412 [Phakopsora pachyrhizi]|uniref:Uncharacterized protein n=1 Tax=Phakopsora pachyrhizi TaxID=170000 RepID=A0AAV0ALK6_PHAPC|nr:hypothetical protein PPACK8108_LOCUS3412 [Phakopsora pachyrhizi]
MIWVKMEEGKVLVLASDGVVYKKGVEEDRGGEHTSSSRGYCNARELQAREGTKGTFHQPSRGRGWPRGRRGDLLPQPSPNPPRLNYQTGA